MHTVEITDQTPYRHSHKYKKALNVYRICIYPFYKISDDDGNIVLFVTV